MEASELFLTHWLDVAEQFEPIVDSMFTVIYLQMASD